MGTSIILHSRRAPERYYFAAWGAPGLGIVEGLAI
jgi:hypothetical protein